MPDDIKKANIVKAHTIQLPSRGYMYDGKLDQGMVNITPLTGRDESLLAARGTDKANLLDDIIARHMDMLGVDFQSLLVGDKLFALCMIRFISFGPEYRVKIECPSCSSNNNFTIRMPEELEIQFLDEKDAVEPIEIGLPLSGKRIGVRHLRVADEKKIRVYGIDARRGMTRYKPVSDPEILYTKATSIATVDGSRVTDIHEVIRWLDSDDFLIGDSQALEDQIEKISCGLKIFKNFACPVCQRENRSRVPVDAEFFRPRRDNSASI